MNPRLLNCAGVTDGPLTIPPFELKRGDSVCLQFPLNYTSEPDSEKRIYQMLTGQRSVPGLRLQGRVAWVIDPCGLPGQGGWRDRLRELLLPSPRVVAWLRKQSGMSQTQAAEVVERLGLPSHCRLNRLPGNPRMLLGLEAAFASEADILVVRLVGIDYMGRQAALSLVAERLEQRAVIYVLCPFWHQYQLHLDSVPGLPCYSLQWNVQPAPLANSA